jgi:hypothetical protein
LNFIAYFDLTAYARSMLLNRVPLIKRVICLLLHWCSLLRSNTGCDVPTLITCSKCPRTGHIRRWSFLFSEVTPPSQKLLCLIAILVCPNPYTCMFWKTPMTSDCLMHFFLSVNVGVELTAYCRGLGNSAGVKAVRGEPVMQVTRGTNLPYTTQGQLRPSITYLSFPLTCKLYARLMYRVPFNYYGWLT